MKNVIKKIASIAMAFTLLGVGTAVTKTVAPQSENTITAYADTSVTIGTVTLPPYKVTLKNPKSWLNVRKGPGTKYSIVGKRYHGNIVYVGETKGNWACIGKDQWVSMSYLTKLVFKNGQLVPAV